MAKKAQSAIEYLATYGWAFLLLALVISFLIGSGIFSPSRFANEECTFQPNLPCSQYYAQPIAGQSKVKLFFNITNTMGFPIAILGISSNSNGIASECAGGCNKYLLQGESAAFTFEPSMEREYYEGEMANLKLSMKFRGCKGIDEAKCLTDATLAYYTTSGRILASLRSALPSGTASSCTSSGNFCDGTVLNFCSGGDMISKNCAPETCTGSGAGAKCTGSCTPADERCDGNVRYFCLNGNLASESCLNICSPAPAPHCTECKDGDTSCPSERELATCNGGAWNSIYCQDLDATKEYCSDFAGTPKCAICLSGKIKCATENAYRTCDGNDWMSPPQPCADPTPFCRDGGISGDDACAQCLDGRTRCNGGKQESCVKGSWFWDGEQIC